MLMIYCQLSVPPWKHNQVSFYLLLGEFVMNVEPGEFTDSQIIVMLGENGTGKTTFIRMLAGRLTPDDGSKRSYCSKYFSSVLFGM